MPPQQRWIISNSLLLSWAPAGSILGTRLGNIKCKILRSCISFSPASSQCHLHRMPENMKKKKALQLLQVPGVVAPRCWMTTTSGLNIPSNGSVWENNLKGYSVQDRKHLGIPAVCTQGPIGWHFNPIETQLQTKDTHRAAFDILLFASSHPYTSHADSKSLLRTFFGRQSTSLL